MILAALGGLVVGAGHAVSGPDHLAAVVPLAAGRSGRGVWSGFVWGAGHGMGVLVLGDAALVARQLVDLERLSGYAELIVGVTLVLMGLWTARRTAHARRQGWAPAHDGVALSLGVLHGAAGGSHIVVLLTAVGLPVVSAGAWMVSFVAGAAAAMMAVAWLVQGCRRRMDRSRWVVAQTVAGLACAAVGVVWVAATLVG